MDHVHDEITLYRTPIGFMCFSHHYPVYASGSTLQACLESLYAQLTRLLISGKHQTLRQAVGDTADATLDITTVDSTPTFHLAIFDNGWEHQACQVGKRQNVSKVGRGCP